MIALALKLVFAHLLGDFLFQPDKWVNDKREKKQRSIFLYWHMGVHVLLLILLLQFQYWIGIGVIISTHFVIDLMKLHLENKTNRRLLFFVDQLTHFFVIGIVVYAYHPFSIDYEFLYHPKTLLFSIALLFVTFVTAVLMKIMLSNWEMVENEEEVSLPNAGKYIGMLERLFIFGFILLQQWGAIGLLIAAKSVFRFNDLTRAKDRKLTEYILIGTLLSFGFAILVALLFQAALRLIPY